MWDSLFDLGKADSLSYGTVRLNVQLFHLENSDAESSIGGTPTPHPTFGVQLLLL